MKLSRFFTLHELIHSQQADRAGIANIPGPSELANLKELALLLDQVRRLLGRPVFISSGFRNPAVNKLVKGSKTSSHMTGSAADFTCPGYGKTMDVFDRIIASGIEYDQLIAEYPKSPTGGWVHIGLGVQMRRQNLIYDGKTYRPVK